MLPVPINLCLSGVSKIFAWGGGVHSVEHYTHTLTRGDTQNFCSMHLTEKLLYGEGTFDKFCSVGFLHKIFTYSSRALKARAKNVTIIYEIAPQAKIILKNAYFLEIFNENTFYFFRRKYFRAPEARAKF